MSKIYMWLHPTVPEKNTLQYVEDAVDGGCIVNCGFCLYQFKEKDVEECPNCGKDLIYPRAEW